MKAEHRKELQTNSLADFLGRMLQARRSGPGISWFPVAIVALVVVAIFVVFWLRANQARTASEAWTQIDYGTFSSLQGVAEEYPETRQGKAAKYTVFYAQTWMSIQQMAAPGGGKVSQDLERYLAVYNKLAEDEDEPEFQAEAKYLAYVCHECLAVTDLKSLESAKKILEELGGEKASEKLRDTAYGQMAKKRLERYDNPYEFSQIQRFYAELKLRTMAFGEGP